MMTTDSIPLYYIPTKEGIASHIFQLNWIYSRASNYSRNVVITSFDSSAHFCNGDTTLCEYLDFPSGIKCAYGSYKWIAKTKSCVILGEKKDWTTNHKDYGLARNTPLDINPNWSHIECVAGKADHRYRKRDENIFANSTFKKKYMNYYDFAMEILNFTIPLEYAVIHWRRGKEFYSRCINATLSYHCFEVDDFINVIHNIIQVVYIPKDMLIYIATNEMNENILLQLESKGYKTHRSLQPFIGLHPLSVDMFFVELIMMCHAQVFISEGHTSIKFLVEICRKANNLGFTMLDVTKYYWNSLNKTSLQNVTT
jgi:hypothetical protein